MPWYGTGKPSVDEAKGVETRFPPTSLQAAMGAFTECE